MNWILALVLLAAVPKTETPASATQRFFNWYLAHQRDENIEPKVIVTDVAVQLDVKAHIAALKASGLLSRRYLEEDRKALEACNAEAAKMKTKAPEFFVSYCPIVTRDEFTRSWDTHGQAKVVRAEKQKDGTTEVEVELTPATTSVLVRVVTEDGRPKLDAFRAKDVH